MSSIKDNLSAFDEYNELQEDIDKIKVILVKLAEEDGIMTTSANWYYDDIKATLGSEITNKVKKAIVALLEREKNLLLGKQRGLNVKE